MKSGCTVCVLVVQVIFCLCVFIVLSSVSCRVMNVDDLVSQAVSFFCTLADSYVADFHLFVVIDKGISLDQQETHQEMR